MEGVNNSTGAKVAPKEPMNCAKASIILIGVALFIIGCIGAAGAFNGTAIGWTTLGLAGSSLLLTASLWDKKHKWALIEGMVIFAALVVIGALGGSGIITGTGVGYGILIAILPPVLHKICEGNKATI